MEGAERRIDCPFSGAYLTYAPVADARGLIVVCPGGGYRRLSGREGAPVAAAFARGGYQALVLNYTVDPAPLGTLPLQELAWAVETARIRPEWRGLPAFACGFSAGGHLCASLGVHFADNALFPPARQDFACRPDGLILCYPVVAAGAHAHHESFARLCGHDARLAEYFSVERFVTKDTPGAFLWHTAADESVPVENALLFYEALLRAGVRSELHIFPNGAHGLSLATREVNDPLEGRAPDPRAAAWFGLCLAWLESYAPCAANKGA
ncbi:MAG TPA: alpha/beta hydrolase [Clostridia bacterium]|nr:alpha/beta hydrolase [Clostridia bacterium]